MSSIRSEPTIDHVVDSYLILNTIKSLADKPRTRVIDNNISVKGSVKKSEKKGNNMKKNTDITVLDNRTGSTGGHSATIVFYN